MRFCTLAAALAACLLVAADGKDDDVKKEIKKFEGAWTMVSGEHAGKKVADEDVKKSKITWKGLEVTLETPHQSAETIKATSTLDPSKSPKEIDWVRSSGPDAGKTMKGIYEFIEVDQYRVCFAPAGKDRPTDFKTSEGSGLRAHVWKRSKD